VPGIVLGMEVLMVENLRSGFVCDLARTRIFGVAMQRPDSARRLEHELQGVCGCGIERAVQDAKRLELVVGGLPSLRGHPSCLR
jgi:hypothetical protein